MGSLTNTRLGLGLAVIAAGAAIAYVALWDDGSGQTSPPTYELVEPGVWPPADLGVSEHLAGDARAAQVLPALEADFRATPTDPGAVSELALFLVNQHEYIAAEPLVRWLALNAPDPEAALGLLGSVQMRLGHLDRADAIFALLLQRFPTSWNGHYHRGLVAFRRQELTSARDHLEAAIASDPGVPFPHQLLGVVYRRMGEPAKAVEPLRTAMQLMPDHPNARFDLINALDDLKRTPDADAETAAYWARRRDGGTPTPIAYSVDFDATPPEHVGAVRFTDVAAEMGLDNVGRGRAGALVDFDGDGDLDIFAGNLEERGRVYRNEGGGLRWTEVSDEVGLGWFDSGYGQTFADYDNDGDPDLYVTRGGFQNGRPGRDSNLLFRNDSGKFTDVTLAAGVGDQGTGFGSVWADFDNDGAVDLYVANNYSRNTLFRSRGDGTFEDVTAAAGVGDRRSISAAVADYDDDGDLDIYVANNGEPNALFRNDGDMRFTDVTAAAGVGVTAGFASVAGDFDNDGDMDIYVTNMNNWLGGRDYRPNEPCSLFLNQGNMTFKDVGVAAGVGYVGGPMGLNAGDIDYDGWLDLYLGNGGPEPRRWEPDVLYRNLGPDAAGALRFANVTRQVGAWNPRMGHGLAFGDMDHDGDLDIYIPNGAHIESDITHNILWRNDGHNNHWLVVELAGTRSNRSAIGARVTLHAAGLVHAEEVSGGSGFGAQNSLELEFGLGARTAVERLEVRWPSGLKQTFTDPPIDRFLRIKEGTDVWTVSP